MCQTRCATKKCSCKRQGNICGPQCHPGRACINTGSQKLAAMQSTAVIEVAETNAVQEKNIWTVVGQISLSITDKDILTSNMWLNDRHIDAAQTILRNTYGIAGLDYCSSLEPLCANIKPQRQPLDDSIYSRMPTCHCQKCTTAYIYYSVKI